MRDSEDQPRGRQPFGLITGERQTRGGVIAPERPKEKELAPPPTQEETVKANAGGYAGSTRTVEKVGGNRFLKVALGGGAIVGAGAVAYEAVPAVHQAVDSAFLDHLKGKSLSSDSAKTEVFDPQAKEGVIKPSMVERLPQAEIAKLDPLEKIDDHNTVQILQLIDISTSDNPNSELQYKKLNGDSGDEQDRMNRAKEGFLNLILFDKVPAGSTILAPADGRLILYDAYPRNFNPALKNNDHPIGSAAIDFTVRGEKYRMLISGRTKGGMRSRGDVFRSLTNAPIITDGMSEQLKFIEQKAISIKKGDSILQVADTEITMSIHMLGNTDVSKGKKGIINGEEVLLVREEPTNLEFFLSPNGKLIASAK